MDVCWEGANILALRLCCFTLCCLDFWVPFPHGVWGRKWNSIISVHDHCLLIYFEFLAMLLDLELVYCENAFQ